MSAPIAPLDASQILAFEVCIIGLDNARTFADELRDGAVAHGSQWSARKAHVAELHNLCRRLIDERATVARRLKRQAGILKSLLSIDQVHERLVATLAQQLPDVERANLETRLSALVASPAKAADRLVEVTIETVGGAR